MPVIYKYQEVLRRRLRQIARLKLECEHWQERARLDPAFKKFHIEQVAKLDAKIAALESKKDS
ncbi:MAG TPA: hypothetical protein VEV41_18310 [Terriglobales bacterium]|nr:hypothetical protein [Terriglobales bacterium]